MTDRELRNRLDHQHEMLHGISFAIADLAEMVSHLVSPAGAMTPEEVAAVTTRLKGQADKLRAIATPPPAQA